MRRPYSPPLAPLFTVVVLLLAACSGSSAESADTTLAPTTTEQATATATATTAATTTTTAPTTTADTTVEAGGVSTTVVTGTGTRDITVWKPDGDGPWPVVYAVPGSGGSATRDLDVFAQELTSHGVVVFGTDFEMASGRDAIKNVECGYRFMLDTASDHGGDLSQPVTFFGYSAGATGALIHGLDEINYGPDSFIDQGCQPGAERPDIIVSVNGCHQTNTEIERRLEFWANPDAEITLIAAENDEICLPQQSKEAQSLLTEAGYDATYVEIPDANHWQVVFHDLSYGSYKTLEPDNPAGQATVQATLDAIGINSE